MNQGMSKDDVLALQQALDNSYDGILIIDTNSNIVFTNEPARRLFGYSQDEMQGSPLSILVKKDTLDLRLKKIINKINKENSWNGELSVKRKNGDEFLIWLAGNMVRNKKSSKIIFVFRDITEWKCMENELKSYAKKVEDSFKVVVEEKLKSEAVFASIADGLFTVDNNWIITSFNPGAEKIIGIKAKNAIGKCCREIFHGELCKKDCALSESKKNGYILLNKEGRIKKKSGDWIPVMVSTAPLRSPDGKIIGGVETFRDVSELEKINKELIQLNNVKTDFLSMVSHELKTPLTIVKGYVELLIHERLGTLTPKQKDVTEIIKNKIDKLNLLINDLLDVSQMEFGKFKIAKNPFDIIELVVYKKKEFQVIAEKKNLALNLILYDDKIIVNGDKERLSQVLSNLITNAIKFTESKGKITIKLETKQDYLYIHVIDTGIGIAPEQVNKIFDKFYQVDASCTRKYNGVGLGLAISRDIIKLHDGKIIVKSEPGKGSTFTIIIPQ
ncbi:PAS domain-containing sensor histidine kinase [Candidatus Poribacteria bacterium]|nr:PAS domain-containing sensor histidine kinase [Candidatus Poribacteria bacterium]